MCIKLELLQCQIIVFVSLGRDLDLSLGFDGFVVHAKLLVVIFGDVSVSPQVEMLLLGDALHHGWLGIRIRYKSPDDLE